MKSILPPASLLDYSYPPDQHTSFPMAPAFCCRARRSDSPPLPLPTSTSPFRFRQYYEHDSDNISPAFRQDEVSLKTLFPSSSERNHKPLLDLQTSSMSAGKVSATSRSPKQNAVPTGRMFKLKKRVSRRSRVSAPSSEAKSRGRGAGSPFKTLNEALDGVTVDSGYDSDAKKLPTMRVAKERRPDGSRLSPDYLSDTSFSAGWTDSHGRKKQASTDKALLLPKDALLLPSLDLRRERSSMDFLDRINETATRYMLGSDKEDLLEAAAYVPIRHASLGLGSRSKFKRCETVARTLQHDHQHQNPFETTLRRTGSPNLSHPALATALNRIPRSELNATAEASSQSEQNSVHLADMHISHRLASASSGPLSIRSTTVLCIHHQDHSNINNSSEHPHRVPHLAAQANCEHHHDIISSPPLDARRDISSSVYPSLDDSPRPSGMTSMQDLRQPSGIGKDTVSAESNSCLGASQNSFSQAFLHPTDDAFPRRQNTDETYRSSFDSFRDKEIAGNELRFAGRIGRVETPVHSKFHEELDTPERDGQHRLETGGPKALMPASDTSQKLLDCISFEDDETSSVWARAFVDRRARQNSVSQSNSGTSSGQTIPGHSRWHRRSRARTSDGVAVALQPKSVAHAVQLPCGVEQVWLNTSKLGLENRRSLFRNRTSTGSIESWTRYPSHLRIIDTPKAGLSEDVNSRDFAASWSPERRNSFSTSTATHFTRSKSMTFGKRKWKLMSRLFADKKGESPSGEELPPVLDRNTPLTYADVESRIFDNGMESFCDAHSRDLLKAKPDDLGPDSTGASSHGGPHGGAQQENENGNEPYFDATTWSKLYRDCVKDSTELYSTDAHQSRERMPGSWRRSASSLIGAE